MKTVLAFAKSIGFTVAASLIVIWGSKLLGFTGFAVDAVSSLAVAAGLTVAAWAAYYAVATLTVLASRGKVEDFGAVVFTVWGTVAGSIAAWVCGLVAPAYVMLGSFWAGIPFAFAVTMTIWGLAYATRSVRKELSLWPTIK
jgi:hypothetical protein